jgi:hypothetical protein
MFGVFVTFQILKHGILTTSSAAETGSIGIDFDPSQYALIGATCHTE